MGDTGLASLAGPVEVQRNGKRAWRVELRKPRVIPHVHLEVALKTDILEAGEIWVLGGGSRKGGIAMKPLQLPSMRGKPIKYTAPMERLRLVNKDGSKLKHRS